MGWPTFSEDGAYTGPLPARSSPHAPLIGKNDDDEFNTTTTAAYPPGMCMRIASLFFRAWADKQLTLGHTPWDGGEEAETPIAEELEYPIQLTMRPTLRSLNQIASRLRPAAEKPLRVQKLGFYHHGGWGRREGELIRARKFLKKGAFVTYVSTTR